MEQDRAWITRAQLLDQVAEWAKKPPGEEAILNDELNAAVHRIRRGHLSAEQREALAVLVSIAAITTLPTPVVAAVFNVIETCGHALPGESVE